jgi:four helix bundle protein
MFPHEKLSVYAKSLEFVAQTSACAVGWDKRHAVVDQFGRASDSLVLNLVEGARLRPGRAKLRALDCALGSCLECAACLDIAGIKGFSKQKEFTHHKQQLWEITRMLIGLAKVWESWRGHEDSPPYATQPSAGSRQPLFHHETLDVYRAALDLMRWFTSLPGGQDLPSRFHRQVDEGATSIVLNIAEGNGRYSELDHRRFLDLAAAAAVKVAAGLDLAARRALLEKAACEPGKILLERIVAMLSRM